MKPAGHENESGKRPGRSIQAILAVSTALIIIIVISLALTVSYLQASDDAARRRGSPGRPRSAATRSSSGT